MSNRCVPHTVLTSSKRSASFHIICFKILGRETSFSTPFTTSARRVSLPCAFTCVISFCVDGIPSTPSSPSSRSDIAESKRVVRCFTTQPNRVIRKSVMLRALPRTLMFGWHERLHKPSITASYARREEQFASW